MKSRAVATFLALCSCGSPAPAQQTWITLEWNGAQRISKVSANDNSLIDANPQKNIFAAVTPAHATRIRITVERTPTTTPDSYQIAVGLQGNDPIELSIPSIDPIPCTAKVANTLARTQYAANAALFAILQARYLLRGVCGTVMQEKMKGIFLDRTRNLTTALGHKVDISVD
jgi:hypothetical protein